jgi:hypothetical protein
MFILLPSVYLRLCNASITQHIMQSHSSKVKHSSSTSRSSDTILQDHKAPNNAPDWKHRWKARRDVCNPPTMFSDPLDSSSSNTRSFDDDDMYGSDSGVETISLKHDLKEKARDNKETMVCTCPTMYIRAILHLRQEDGLYAVDHRSLPAGPGRTIGRRNSHNGTMDGRCIHKSPPANGSSITVKPTWAHLLKVDVYHNWAY